MFNINTKKWEKVITTNWTIDDANTVCRETGHEEALEHIPVDLIEKIRTLNRTLFPNKVLATRTWKKKCTDSDYSIWLCEDRHGGRENGIESVVGVRCRVSGRNIAYFIIY